MFLNKINKFKSAFTMAEMLTVIGVLGVLAAISIPIIIHSLPTKEEQMHNKMSYLVEQITQQMYDNESYYPRTLDPNKAGFMNTDEVTVDGVKYGGKDNVAASEKAANELARKEKFCKLFAHQFNKLNNATCPEKIEGTDPSFRSTDGVDWWIPLTTFKENTNGQSKGYVKIKIDVNGTDKGSNCAEGAVNCKKPDTFYYYIKTNGSVTLSDPLAVDNKIYQIIPTIVTRDINGDIINIPGGTLEIASINADGSFGEFYSAASKFKNLNANSNYILRAKPSDGFVSNWKTRDSNVEAEKHWGFKKVRTSKMNTEVQLEFRQVSNFCINLEVDGPEAFTSENFSTYLSSAKYSYNCSYVYKGDNQGDYKRVSELLDTYDYAGPFKGSYKFECSSSANLSVTDGKLYVCGLKSGEYQLKVEPQEGLCLYPKTIDNKYIQNVRLGSLNADFNLNIRYNCDPLIVTEKVESGNELNCPEGAFQVEDFCVKDLGVAPCPNVLHDCNEYAQMACTNEDMTLATKDQLKTIYNYQGTIAEVPIFGEYWAKSSSVKIDGLKHYMGISFVSGAEVYLRAGITYYYTMCVSSGTSE